MHCIFVENLVVWGVPIIILYAFFMAVPYYILWRYEWKEVEDIETFPPSIIQSPSMLYKFQDTMNSIDL